MVGKKKKNFEKMQLFYCEKHFHFLDSFLPCGRLFSIWLVVNDTKHWIEIKRTCVEFPSAYNSYRGLYETVRGLQEFEGVWLETVFLSHFKMFTRFCAKSMTITFHYAIKFFSIWHQIQFKIKCCKAHYFFSCKFLGQTILWLRFFLFGKDKSIFILSKPLN